MISPIMSILTHLHQSSETLPPKLELLYAYRRLGRRGNPKSAMMNAGQLTEPALFFKRLTSLFASKPFVRGATEQTHFRLKFFLTQPADLDANERPSKISESLIEGENVRGQEQVFSDLKVPTEDWRITKHDLEAAVNDVVDDKRKGILAYVCGPPSMTDWAVSTLKSMSDIDEKKVLCEKWW